MTQCLNCKTGKLKASGSYLFCDNCNFSILQINQDYIEASATLLGVLSSNIAFNSYKAYKDFVVDCIKDHVPYLHTWLNSVTNGYHEFISNISDLAKTQAVDLQIAEEQHNAVEDTDLKCVCGHSDFDIINPSTLECKECRYPFVFSVNINKYAPAFSCVCGCQTFYVWEDLNSRQDIVKCTDCSSPYIHLLDNHTFSRIGG